MEKVVRDVPPPSGDPDAPLRALIFDCQYDAYRGIIVYIRILDGSVGAGDSILMMNRDSRYEVVEVGHMLPIGVSPCERLMPGEVGYITASIKALRDVEVGDTVTSLEHPCSEPLPRLISLLFPCHVWVTFTFSFVRVEEWTLYVIYCNSSSY